MKGVAKGKSLTLEDRQAIEESLRRFYSDPEKGGVRAAAEMVEAFDFSVDPPRQIRDINPYAVQRIATALQTYFRGKDSLDEAFGFLGTGRGSRSAGTKYRQAEKEYRIVFDYLIAKEGGRSYEAAVALTAELHNTSPETVKRFIKK